MSEFELVAIGVVTTFMVVIGWQQRSAILLYINAGFMGLYALDAISFDTQFAREAAFYAIVVAIGLALTGLIIDRVRH